MKIDGNNPNLSSLKNEPVDPAVADANSARSGSGLTPARDELRLSPDVEIAREAIRQAAAVPEIRHDLVERVRKLLESGQVGGDSGQLADAIINSLIDQTSNEQE